MGRARMMVAAGCVLAAGMTAVPAEAATFSAEVGFPETVVISYSATMGERNAVTAEYDVAARRFVLTDPGADFILNHPVSTRGVLPSTTDGHRHCTFERRRVTCVFPPAPEPYNDPKYPMPHLLVDLGDGDDSLSMDTEGVAHGGPGADRITSVATEAHLHYYGGAFLYGDDGDDRLIGGIGWDDLQGGGGADVITGGPGEDGVAGGDGDDRIELRDGEADNYSCDAGADTLLADPFDAYAHDGSGCESIAVGS